MSEPGVSHTRLFNKTGGDLLISLKQSQCKVSILPVHRSLWGSSCFLAMIIVSQICQPCANCSLMDGAQIRHQMQISQGRRAGARLCHAVLCSAVPVLAHTALGGFGSLSCHHAGQAWVAKAAGALTHRVRQPQALNSTACGFHHVCQAVPCGMSI